MNFNLDTRLKQRALRKAKADGITFSSVLKQAVKDYVEGSLELRLMNVDPPLNAASAKRVRKAIVDIDAGKHQSPVFTNAKDAMRYLRTA